MPGVNIVMGGNDGSNTLQGTPGADLIYGYDPNGPQSQASSILATRVAADLTQPLFAGAPPGDTGRLFIVQQTGQIKILDLTTGQVLPTPFLDVSASTLSDVFGERGLLGLAFDPDFASNGFFYINRINLAGDTEILRYHASANPNVADPASVTPVIIIDQPDFPNHKAGWLGFGPDGYLYAALGDGGGDGGSGGGNGQNIDTLLGKILRLDVHGDDFPDPNTNYAVPPNNPFVGVAGADEIFAYGLRNPWRPSFDRATGDFYIADVGQASWEEIDIGQIGANYGWKVFEGPDPYAGGTPTGGSAVAPIYAYPHAPAAVPSYSITGGYIYRGAGEALQGQYFFADFVQGTVFTLRYDTMSSSWVATEQTAQIVPDFGVVNGPSSFGEDARGNLYLVDFYGEVFRLTPVGASADQADVLRGLGGNDMLFGGSGNDLLNGGSGADTLVGGPGSDTADYSSSPAAVMVNLQTGLGSGGDAQGDILNGVENIIGSAFNDTLAGDSGANTLAGGMGADRFVLHGPLEGVDTFGDFSGGEGDLIVLDHVVFGLAGTGSLAAAGVNFFRGTTAPTAGPTLLENQGNLYWDPDGTGPSPAVQLAYLPHTGWLGSIGDPETGGWNVVATGAFNNGGTNDILWQNASTGASSEWLMANGTLASNPATPAAPGWNVIAAGDFSGDGITDLLWRHASAGVTSEWVMAPNGGVANLLNTPAAQGWNVIATADFNGDHTADLLWQHASTGMTAEWLMAPNGGIGAILGTPPAQGWNLIATADLNGDHVTDLLWQHASSGATAEWLMAPTGGVGSLLSTPAAQGWSVIATADFNGDGTTDLMWQHASSGATAQWLMAPTGGVGSLLSTPGAPGWNVIATGDFNGDHVTDLLWQHASTGMTAEWLMAPTGGVGTLLGTPAAQGWNVVAAADFNGDHITDVLWKHASAGVTSLWLMAPNGGVGRFEGTPAAVGLDLLAPGDFNGDGATDLLWRNPSTGATTTWAYAQLSQQDFLVV